MTEPNTFDAERTRLAAWLRQKAHHNPGRIQLSEDEALLCADTLESFGATGKLADALSFIQDQAKQYRADMTGNPNAYVTKILLRAESALAAGPSDPEPTTISMPAPTPTSISEHERLRTTMRDMAATMQEQLTFWDKMESDCMNEQNWESAARYDARSRPMRDHLKKLLTALNPAPEAQS